VLLYHKFLQKLQHLPMQMLVLLLEHIIIMQLQFGIMVSQELQMQ